MQIHHISDYQLVKQFLNGDSASFEKLMKRHQDRVYTYIMLMVKDQQLAEDIFQDTFIKVINSLKAGKYTEDGKFVSWVTRIAHNLVIDYFRKSKQMRMVSNEDKEYDLFNSKDLSDSTVEENIIADQITRDLRKIINELPEDQKEVILLRHFSGLSFKEIADQTNVSINTALGRMRYAIINLRKIIEKKNINLAI